MLDRRSTVICGFVFVLAALPAQAEDRTPRSFWLGAPIGMAYTDDIAFASGVELGVQRISGGTAMSLEANVLPLGGLYTARGSVVLGHGFTTHYTVPCAPTAGYDSCQKIYTYRMVRSVIGLELGAQAGVAGDGGLSALEVGLGVRGQLSVDLAFAFDPVRAAPGGELSFAWQLGAFYLGIEVRALAGDQPAPIYAAFKLGYASKMF